MRTVARLSTLIFLTFGLACHRGESADDVASPSPATAEAKRVRLRHLRFSTDKEKMQWERAIEAVWKTPLGEMYAEYLFSPTEDHADLPLWARMLTERIFREVRHLRVRLDALQVMEDDLYVREMMTADVNDRITILQGHIDQERIRISTRADDRVFAKVSVAMLIAVPVGSKTARHHILNQGRRLLGRPMQPRALPMTSLSPAKMILNQSFEVLNAFTWVLFFASAAEWLANDWFWNSTWAPKDEVMLLSLDDLVTSMDLVSTGQTHLTFPYAQPRTKAHP